MALDRLRNWVKIEVERHLATQSHPRQGLVTAYDPKTYTVRVKLQPTGEETGWIPIESHGVGNGVGMFWGPNINDQVSVGFEEGNPNRPKVTGRYFSDVDIPLPADTSGAGVPSGEVWLVGANDNRMSLSADGKTVTLKHHNGSSIVMDGTADTVTLTHHSGTTLLMDNGGKVTVSGSGGSPLAVKRIDDTPSPWLRA